MDLYYNPISAFSHKARMALFEKDVSFNPKLVNFFDPSAREQYRAIYPLGKLPCLGVEGTLIGESTNIIEWLDLRFDHQKLIPEDAQSARLARYWDRMSDTYITQNAILLFFQSLKPEVQRDTERCETARRQIKTVYSMLEPEINADSPFLLEQLSLADISLVCGLAVSAGFVELNQHPNLAKYSEALKQRPAFAQATAGFMDAVTAVVSGD